MKPWLNWKYAIRILGIAAMGVGVLWHEGALVITGLGVAAGPSVWQGGR